MDLGLAMPKPKVTLMERVKVRLMRWLMQIPNWRQTATE